MKYSSTGAFVCARQVGSTSGDADPTAIAVRDAFVRAWQAYETYAEWKKVQRTYVKPYDSKD